MNSNIKSIEPRKSQATEIDFILHNLISLQGVSAVAIVDSRWLGYAYTPPF